MVPVGRFPNGMTMERLRLLSLFYEGESGVIHTSVHSGPKSRGSRGKSSYTASRQHRKSFPPGRFLL
ncbi:hypothetical protein CEXT_284321 [Caerostris extrusa]|uniref:Ycf15 n=1 Tax=Caerostris extrusa TaxID=172846 RepID=A0AAV4PZT2_CAEEX|nr:hypothetical protein CEXT_284321 [Caerostris extrusa]